MVIAVDAHSGVPIYRQLMEQIRFRVASGVLRAGDELPSTRELSAEVNVNPMTVSKAYARLEAEAVLERRPGLCLVVRARSRAEARDAKQEALRRSLAEGVAAVRQLGLSGSEAVAEFRRLLAEAGIEEEA
jgi:GntR family transcriptional regulator